MKTTFARLALGALALGWLIAHDASAQTKPGTAPQTGHRHTRSHHHRVAARTLAPIPAQPADRQASATTPAPVPNESVGAPNDPVASGASVAPSVFQLHYPPQGEGYVTGSSPQAMDDRNAAKATGVQMKVPLPQ